MTLSDERWPIAGGFSISRGDKSEAHVVVATIRDGPLHGWGECVPYAHYGETVDGVMAELTALSDPIAAGMDRQELLARVPPGAARNALDCALWDLACQDSGRPVWALCGLAEPRALDTAFTLSIASADENASHARAHAGWPVLKVKLGRDDDLERMRAIRSAAPRTVLHADVNEGWDIDAYNARAPALSALGVRLLEQPLPPTEDAALRGAERPIALCADESYRGGALVELTDRYQVVNLKLDKLGGLTAALVARAEALTLGLEVMVGCMCSTSLSLAPAMLLAAEAQHVDLDAGLLLTRDRPDGVVYHDWRMQPSPRLWGIPRATDASTATS